LVQLAAVGRSGHVAKDAGAVAEQGVLSFAVLLRQLRAEAGLTQEELAEAARLSPRSISDLERGINRTARKDTALLLADALTLAGPVREQFVAAARGNVPASDVLAARRGEHPGAFAAAATRALPRDIASFTGRDAELKQLFGATDTLATHGGVVGIHAIDGMAGVGKTTFAVHAAHRLAGDFPDGQFFLPLHAHTRGQGPVEPADALASLLLTAGLPAAQIPPGLEARAGRWRDYVANRRVLLVLDDAVGHEQVRPLLPGTAGSLVLITSRRRLAALDAAVVISLDTLPPDDAAALLTRLAALPGLRAGNPAVDEMAGLCGYLPLAIGMLASQLSHHPAWSADHLADQLATARDRLALMHAEDLSVAAAFDLSYAELTPQQQRLFRYLGLVPGPSFDGYAAAALAGTSFDQASRHLEELYSQHLVGEPAPGRFQLHDLLREHARSLAADDPADSDAATGRLLDYYLHTALEADRLVPAWDTAYRQRPVVGFRGDVPDLPMLGNAAGWLEAERPNLHAAADHASASGRHLHAVHIPAAMAGFLRERGHWDQATALQETALTAAQRAGDRAGQAGALHELGLMRTITGDYPAAVVGLAQAVALYADIGDPAGQAFALCQLGIVQSWTGDYPGTIAGNERALTLARTCGDQRAEACALQSLGYVQQAIGDYAASAASLAAALDLYLSLGHRLGVAETLSNLGVLQTATGDYTAAGTSSHQALKIFRELGDRPQQAWVLNDLGVMQRLTGEYAAAAISHQQALDLWADLGNRLGQAEALNGLGELALRTSAASQARDQHTKALAMARVLGAAPEEARALEGLGNSHLHDGNPGQAAVYLRQALAIYQRIGTPAALRIRENLQRHGLASTRPEHQPAESCGKDPQPGTGGGDLGAGCEDQ
jgi:tetratricopeptide (TPR) repeat protein/transcriptional regulator with XRE-family HTH domain